MLKAIDVSVWQAVGSYGTDYDGLICKATGSDMGNYVDPNCDGHYQRAKSQGKLLGVYHFANPYAGSAEEQAQFFVDNIRGYIGEAILVLDWEMGVEQTGWAKAWLDKVYELTGVKPLIYMSASVVNGYDWSAVAGADYGLWIAGYPAEYNVPTPPTPSIDNMPFSIGAWGFWAIWQYSSSAGSLDLDIANMDRDAWMAYAGKSGEAKPAPQPTPAPAPEPSYQEYVVQSGDNLSLVAEKFGTSWKKIYEDNKNVIGGDPNYIVPGMVLRIYGGNQPTQERTHTVQSGENLSLIAEKYGTTWQKIYEDNRGAIGGDPNYIVPGMTLVIK